MNKLSDAYEYLKNVYINMVKNAIDNEENNNEDLTKDETNLLESNKDKENKEK